MQDINKRLDKIEERLFSIEQQLGLAVPVAVSPARAEPAVVQDAQPQPPAIPPAAQPAMPPVLAQAPVSPRQVASAGPAARPKLAVDEPVSATRLMAWCASFAFVLAVIYFLRLIYDAGWLTPVRQVVLAYLSAAGLISLGNHFAKRDRQYAAYLPAVGLVVLYLTTYTAHLYYHLFDRSSSVIAISLITLLGIWLGRMFSNSVYVLFSAIGVYVTPLLIRPDAGELVDLVVYFTAWSLFFSFCAILEKRRLTYLLPMYLAMLCFEMVWRDISKDEWILSASYQFIQFLIFSLATILFSVGNRMPINAGNTLSHAVALFIFYGIEYGLLNRHIPEYVDYIAILSGVLVYLMYCLARAMYEESQSLKQGAALVSWYCSWVAVHAVFFGVVSMSWFPWFALLAPLILMLLAPQFTENKQALFPIRLACLGLSYFGYTMLVLQVVAFKKIEVMMPSLALFLYAGLLYVMYFHFSRNQQSSNNASIALYAGHLAMIAVFIDVIEKDIYLSAVWATYAVILLVVAMQLKDKLLGQSALLVFTVSGLKVLLFDLSGSNSLIRVFVLLMLSASLYLGGWLYQSLVSSSEEES